MKHARHMRSCTYACIHIRVHTCTNTTACLTMHPHSCVHMYMCVCVTTRKHVYMHAWMRVYRSLHIYIYTRMNIYTYSCKRMQHHVHVCVYLYMFICCVHLYAPMCTRTYVRVHDCTLASSQLYTRARAHVCMRLHLRNCTHIRARNQSIARQTDYQNARGKSHDAPPRLMRWCPSGAQNA